MSTNPFAVPADLHAARRVDTSITSVRSDSQLPAAMNALASCADVRRDVEKALAPSRERLAQAEEEALEVPFRSKSVALKVFEEHLQSHVEAYCRRRGSNLFPVGARTRVFGRGSVLLRSGVERVEHVNGLADDAINAALLERAREVLESALEAVGLDGLVRIKVELDRRAAAKATPDRLAEVGLRLGKAPDTVSIKV
jgi:hypothetical protein